MTLILSNFLNDDLKPYNSNELWHSSPISLQQNRELYVVVYSSKK